MLSAVDREGSDLMLVVTMRKLRAYLSVAEQCWHSLWGVPNALGVWTTGIAEILVGFKDRIGLLLLGAR